MTQYEGKDLTFEVPDEWEDRSVVAYSAPTSRANPNAPNVVVTRDKLGNGEDAAKYANRQIGDLAKQLTGFRLLEQRDVVLGGVPAKELVFSWLGSRGRIVQRLAMVLQGSRVVNVTTTVPTADAAKMAPVFDRIMGSLRFGAPGPQQPKGNAPAVPAPLPTPGSGAPITAGRASASSGQWPAVQPESRPGGPPDTPRSGGMASVPPPSLDRPRSPGGTHQMGAPRKVADADGRARQAAAALWQRPAEGLVARDLFQYVPWACRHEVVYVTDNAQLGVVVASGASKPLVFADAASLAELNAFLRTENVSLPRGLTPMDLAQTVRTLLRGPDAYVGTPGFFQRERDRWELWMGKSTPAAQRAFRAHCEGAVVNARPEGWTLLFSCFSRHWGLERWDVTGEGNRIRSATFSGVEPALGD
jgi:hypothetical protein